MSAQAGRVEPGIAAEHLPAATADPAKHPGGFPWSAVIFLAALVGICGLAVRIGIAPLRLFEHDTFFLLDNGYRVAQGQVPHRDFSSAWGPTTYLLEAAGLWLSGMRPAGIGYASALFGAFAGIWAYWIGRRLFSPTSGCFLGIYTMLLVTAPFALGYGATNFSHAMVYNRYGYAVLGIVLVECVARAIHLNPDRRAEVAGAVSTGAAVALLASLKVSYAAMAAPFLLLSLAVGPSRQKRLAAICGGGAVVGFAVLCYLRFDVADVVRDLLMAASGRSKTWRPGEILTLGVHQFSDVVPLLILGVLAGSGMWSRARNVAIGLVTLAVGGILLSTNHQLSGWPLNGYAAIVLGLAAFRRFRQAGSSPLPDPMALFGIVLVAFCMLPLSYLNGISLVTALVEEQSAPQTRNLQLASDRGGAMILEHPSQLMTTETGGAPYVAAINDGLNLLRQQTGSGDSVLTLDMMNPFNYLLERPSPRGGMAAGAYNYVFSDARHLSGDQFFGTARFVMVRKYSPEAGDYAIETYYIGGLQKIYQPMLQERFRLIEETPHWQLWGRLPGS